MCDNESLINMLTQINTKLDDLLPRVKLIEDRLNKIDYCVSPPHSEIKPYNCDTVEIVSSISDHNSHSDASSYTDDCVSVSQVGQEIHIEKHGLVMSNSNMTELAANTGKLLGCNVALFNYKESQLEPAMFEKDL